MTRHVRMRKPSGAVTPPLEYASSASWEPPTGDFEGDEDPIEAAHEVEPPPPGLQELLRLNLRGDLHAADGEAERIIDGKWELRRLLGAGGFGQVYEAWHLQLERAFAIKLLDPQHGVPELRQRFLEEARLMAGIQSEHLVRASDYGELPDGSPYFVMELVQGRSLRHHLRERMPIARALEIAEELLEGLAEVHKRGVVHGDIKPENVVIGDDDGKARLLDFGLALTSVPTDDEVGGTPPYMAPEMLLEGAPASPRTDVYAVGVVLYEMLTSRMPHGHVDMGFERIRSSWKRKPKADPVRMHRQDVAEPLDAFVMKALSRDPAARPKAAQPMLEELHRLKARMSDDALAVTLVPAPATGVPRSTELGPMHESPVRGWRWWWGERWWWLALELSLAASLLAVPILIAVKNAEPPPVEPQLTAAELGPARDGVLVAAPREADEAAAHAYEAFCRALGGDRRVEGALPVACRRIPTTPADTLVSLADRAGVAVVVLVEDEQITVRSSARHRAHPVLANLDGLPLPADASLTEQVAPVLRAMVDASAAGHLEVPALDWREVGPRWAVLAELLRAQQGHDAHEDRVRRMELRRALDRMLVQAHERGQAEVTGFYRDVAALLEACSPGVDSEATLRELSRAGEHDEAIRVTALLGLAALLAEEGVPSRVEAAESALAEAFASRSDDPCVRLAAVGTISWIDHWNGNDALWQSNEPRLPSTGTCGPVLWNNVLRVRGDALVASSRWCDAARSYEHAYGVLPTALEPLLNSAEYDWLCTASRESPRQALLDQLHAALESTYFERPQQRVSIAYLRWWLTQDPADARAVVERYAEVKEGEAALLEGVASDLEPQICGRRKHGSCSRRILARPKRLGDEARLRRSLGLR